MNVPTIPGQYYVITTASSCTVTCDLNGITYTLCNASAGQAAFCAPSDSVTIDDDTAIVMPTLKVAPVTAQGGGGTSVTVDATYNATSANPQAGTAVMGAFSTYRFNVDQPGLSWGSGAMAGMSESVAIGKGANTVAQTGCIAIGKGANTVAQTGCIAIGKGANTTGNTSVVIGWGSKSGYKGVSIGRECTSGTDAIAISTGSKALGENAISIGRNSNATEKFTTSLGLEAKSTAAVATAIGTKASVADAGVSCISAWDSTNLTTQTQFYLIGAGSSLATTYENGEACLGYVVKDTSGNILFCGTRKLSELLTNNTAFAPAALDLDAPAPTPFLPTGIMEPIVFDNPEEINLQ